MIFLGLMRKGNVWGRYKTVSSFFSLPEECLAESPFLCWETNSSRGLGRVVAWRIQPECCARERKRCLLWRWFSFKMLSITVLQSFKIYRLDIIFIHLVGFAFQSSKQLNMDRIQSMSEVEQLRVKSLAETAYSCSLSVWTGNLVTTQNQNY